MNNNETPESPRRRRRHLGHVAGAVAIVAVVAGAGIAYASIPGSDGVINGCYKPSTGALRVVDSATPACSKGEQSIRWNQTGPQGLTGATGPTGPQGPQGPAGTGGLSTVRLNTAYRFSSSPIEAGASKQVDVTCVGNERLVGGGYEVVPGDRDFVTIVRNSPSPNGTWTVIAQTTGAYDGSSQWILDAYAICATVEST
jgi:hypothetical protein